METYIKLYRRFREWGWYKDHITKAVFLEIILRANYKPSEYMGQIIEAGQCVIGRKALAKELGLSEQNVRTALNHLISTNEITIKSTNKFSVVTVENWAKWQGCGEELTNEPTSELTNDQPTTNQQLTTSKEIKNIRNKEYINNSRFHKPSVEEIQDYMDSRNDGLDANVFFDFYESKGWKVGKNPMKDWKACVRTWERNRNNGDATRGSASGRNNANEYGLYSGPNNGTNSGANSKADRVSEYAKAIEKKFEQPNPFLGD